ncbi:YozE family protein [Pallidibacillus pasinlerensis]|uniref:UPF0346 protein GW534_05515 n=1 Tax=Pallidibacillus pasinlerensis TaxID=2703818 RepID=A0ABX0A720_9BACI|nr:YozE family protein [Pallidibacillus pasinlerensis]NCU17230.1 YozE family protein [Pallidibacillus pasinlerensis]
MGKTFYHFLMRYRSGSDDLSKFAEGAFRDHSFPKDATDYDEISRYLELNGEYLPTMSIFDKAWEYYEQYENKY